MSTLPVAASPVSPVYILAGFLGSGKTTLLKRLLAHELDRGMKPAVLMNEFGETDVDGCLLHDHRRAGDVELQALLNGCVCCDLSADLAASVAHLVEATPGGPVFIETTGLAETGQVVAGVGRALADMHEGEGRAPRAELASVVVMVDTPRIREVERIWAGAPHHAQGAHTIILNKMDQVAPAQADEVERRLRALNPTARIVRAQYADVDPAEVLVRSPADDTGSRGSLRWVQASDKPVDSTEGFRSCSVRILNPLDIPKVVGLLGRHRRSVVRLKGFVRTVQHRGLQEVQWVPGSFEVRPYAAPRRDGARLIIIGRRLAWDRFLEGLDRCVAHPRRKATDGERG
jgi:G3E family GTPase